MADDTYPTITVRNGKTIKVLQLACINNTAWRAYVYIPTQEIFKNWSVTVGQQWTSRQELIDYVVSQGWEVLPQGGEDVENDAGT